MNHKKAGVTILIVDEIDFRTKNMTRYKEGHLKGQIIKKM